MLNRSLGLLCGMWSMGVGERGGRNQDRLLAGSHPHQRAPASPALGGGRSCLVYQSSHLNYLCNTYNYRIWKHTILLIKEFK